MSTFSIFAWILAAAGLQLVVSLWRAVQRARAQRTRLGASVAVAKPAGAVQPSHAAARSGERAFRVVRKQFEDAQRTICSVELVPADGAALREFQPGQFLTVRVPDGSTAGLQRCYSLSNAPGGHVYRLSVKRAGRASGWLHDTLAEGDLLSARDPAGQFFLQTGEAPVVLISAGIGITPMLSMLEHLCMTGSRREAVLLHGVRNMGEFAFAERLEELARDHTNIRVEIWFSEEVPADMPEHLHAHPGRMDVSALNAAVPRVPFDVYLCGPGAMIATLVDGLHTAGVPDARIHYESFGPSTLPATQAPVDAAGIGVGVEFQRSGRDLEWDDSANLLEFAEKHDVPLVSACRSGSCGGCETRIVSGTVTYARQPVHTPAAGHCLPCVCVPKEALVLEA